MPASCAAPRYFLRSASIYSVEFYDDYSRMDACIYTSHSRNSVDKRLIEHLQMVTTARHLCANDARVPLRSGYRVDITWFKNHPLEERVQICPEIKRFIDGNIEHIIRIGEKFLHFLQKLVRSDLLLNLRKICVSPFFKIYKDDVLQRKTYILSLFYDVFDPELLCEWLSREWPTIPQCDGFMQ